MTTPDILTYAEMAPTLRAAVRRLARMRRFPDKGTYIGGDERRILDTARREDRAACIFARADGLMLATDGVSLHVEHLMADEVAPLAPTTEGGPYHVLQAGLVRGYAGLDYPDLSAGPATADLDGPTVTIESEMLALASAGACPEEDGYAVELLLFDAAPRVVKGRNIRIRRASRRENSRRVRIAGYMDLPGVLSGDAGAAPEGWSYALDIARLGGAMGLHREGREWDEDGTPRHFAPTLVIPCRVGVDGRTGVGVARVTSPRRETYIMGLDVPTSIQEERREEKAS